MVAVSTLILIFVFIPDNCAVRHVVLLDDIDRYNESQDPEICVELLDRIISFQEDCEPMVEILDCG